MNYFIARDGKTFGPYSSEAVEKYLSERSVFPTDMARTESTTEWVPLGQLLGLPGASQFPASPQKMPPSLHWGLVFLINMFTSGVFVLVWNFVQSSWVKAIDPKSTATRDYVFAMFLGVSGLLAFGFLIVASVGIGALTDQDHISITTMSALGVGLLILSVFIVVAGIFHFRAIFGIRSSMVHYYNTVEPIQLRMSAIMTFFFNTFYIQHHLTRIANWKRTGVLTPQS